MDEGKLGPGDKKYQNMRGKRPVWGQSEGFQGVLLSKLLHMVDL
jgi:hypothetical protein